jgi:hypothetical protein
MKGIEENKGWNTHHETQYQRKTRLNSNIWRLLQSHRQTNLVVNDILLWVFQLTLVHCIFSRQK